MNLVSDIGQVTIPNAPSFDVDSVTVEGWFRFANVAGAQRLITKSNANADSFGLQFFFGNLQGIIGNGSAGDNVSIPWSPVVGQWYHLAFTFDDQTKRMALLINGQEAASKTTTASIGPSGQPLYMGWYNPFIGSLTDVRIWNEARSTEEINATLGRRVAPDAPGLVADYRFQDGAAQSVLDSSVNANHGKLDGPWWPTHIPGLAPLQTGQFTISAEDGRGGVVEQSFDVQIVDPRTGSLTGLLFEDRNDDGVRQNDEPTIANALVFLDTNGNGFPDADERFARSSSTGDYRFDGLLAGEYALAVEPLAGFVPFPVAPFAVAATQVSHEDVPLVPLALSQIRGQVSLDLDDDGVTREEQPVYFADFASPDVDLSPWSHRTVATSPNGQKFLGRFTNDAVTLNLGSTQDPLPPHDSLTLTFDLLLIESWDGNSSGNGPDRLRFRLDGQDFFLSSFANTSDRQSYPGSYPTGDYPARTGATVSNTLGYTFFGDSIYHLTFQVPHAGSTAQFEFQGIGLASVGDESWGLNQVRVTAPEPFAARWQVFADLDHNGSLDTEEPVATTDAQGNFALSGLPPGGYDIRVAPPVGWRVTQPAAAVRHVSLMAGSVSAGNDFTAVPLDVERVARP